MLSQSGTLNAPLLEAMSDRPMEGGSRPSSLSARQVIKIIRRHELLLGAIVFFAVLIVLVVQLTATPIYQATATVQVELNDDSGSPGHLPVPFPCRTRGAGFEARVRSALRRSAASR